jgi:hypothetical protein
MKALLSFVMFVAACGCPQKPEVQSSGPTTMPTPIQQPPAQQPPAQQPPAQQPPVQQPPGPGSANEPAPNWPKPLPGIGETCGDKDACAQGLTCVAYYGIAGARGPQFKSCEIKCQSDANCSAAHKCVTIADGPGQVCRK